jgi:hypothetical protein
MVAKAGNQTGTSGLIRGAQRRVTQIFGWSEYDIGVKPRQALNQLAATWRQQGDIPVMSVIQLSTLPTSFRMHWCSPSNLTE